MTYIPIAGFTKEEFDSFVPPTGPKGETFPFITGKWKNHTAQVAAVTIQPDNYSQGNDQLVICARNGDYVAYIYANINVNHVSQYAKDPAAQVAKNKEKLMRIMKDLNIVKFSGSQPFIDADLFPQAIGKIIGIGIYGATGDDGNQKYSTKGYPTAYVTFGGLEPKLEAVIDDGLTPVARPQANYAEAPAAPTAPWGAPNPWGNNDDIPI
jgi:hypothetical protein